MTRWSKQQYVEHTEKAGVKKQASKARSRRGRMNKTEAAWFRMLEFDGDVLSARFEWVKFRLADGAWYTPDFLVVKTDGSLEFHEVKGGFAREASRVRFKVARELYPWATWRWVVRQRDGTWEVS